MHQNFEDNEYVKFLGALSDLNQPYSCTQWGNAPDGGYSQIVHDTGSSIYSMLTPNNYVPATVWIDHKMRVHDQMNTAGSWSISSRINSMLEGCGECRIDGELIDDYSTGGESYQQYCCEDFGGTYYEFSNIEDNYCQGSDATWISLCSSCTGTVDTDNDGLADECDDCLNMLGDLNDDMTVDVLDLVSLVNIILNVTSDVSTCMLTDGDINNDDIINIQDVILVINSILSVQIDFNKYQFN